MEAYKNWVRQNKDYVHSLESLANGLTWLLPERFSSSEIGPEAALKELETLVEVVAQQLYGDDKKWNFLVITEASKALLRLALFRDGGYKMLLHGGETPNNDDHPDSGLGDLVKPGENQRPGYFNNLNPQNQWNREGKALSALSRFGENARMINSPPGLSRIQPPGGITEIPAMVTEEKPTLSSILSEKGFRGGLFLIGEILFILRPFIYVSFVRKYGARSWIPWLVSLSVDLVGLGEDLKVPKELWNLYRSSGCLQKNLWILFLEPRHGILICLGHSGGEPILFRQHYQTTCILTCKHVLQMQG
ncbi:hypothetical protein KSS87_009748 [Heliosperma pusillum]|nr:hypothetical protein KSS87_009748 [Heliosperma pusillum]